MSLTVQAGAGPEPVSIDPDAVHRCLMDLAVNAIEAFEGQGGGAMDADAGGMTTDGADEPRRVILRSRRVVLPGPTDEESEVSGASGIEYVVEDNGPGLPGQAGQAGQTGQAGLAGQVEQGVHAGADGFAAFVSAKPGGSGVGLMATRKLAREMGGELELEAGSQGRGVRAVLRVRVGEWPDRTS